MAESSHPPQMNPKAQSFTLSKDDQSYPDGSTRPDPQQSDPSTAIPHDSGYPGNLERPHGPPMGHGLQIGPDTVTIPGSGLLGGHEVRNLYRDVGMHPQTAQPMIDNTNRLFSAEHTISSHTKTIADLEKRVKEIADEQDKQGTTAKEIIDEQGKQGQMTRDVTIFAAVHEKELNELKVHSFYQDMIGTEEIMKEQCKEMNETKVELSGLVDEVADLKQARDGEGERLDTLERTVAQQVELLAGVGESVADQKKTLDDLVAKVDGEDGLVRKMDGEGGLVEKVNGEDGLVVKTNGQADDIAALRRALEHLGLFIVFAIVVLFGALFAQSLPKVPKT